MESSNISLDNGRLLRLPLQNLDNGDRGTSTPIKGLTNNSIINISYQDSTPETVQYNALSQNELNSIVNVTREYPFDYATIMFGYMMPFVLILTLITNTLVVMVLFQRHMRTPTNIVLLTMAIVDLSTLLSPSPWYFYIYTLGYYDKFLYPPFACYVHHIMTDVIPVFFHTSSIWLALLLASQRYIYVCHPTLARTWCTVPRVRKAIIIIIMVAFLHQLTRFFDNTFESIEVSVDDVKHPACKIEISDWVNRVNIAVYYTTYFTFRILFVFIIPCVALITLNCLLFRALRRAENKRTELLRTKFKSIGSERCSVVGLHDSKRLSFNDNNCNSNRQITNEVSSSGLLMANNNIKSSPILQANKRNQKPPVNTIEQIDNIENLGDKSRNFSITLFQKPEQLSKNTFTDACNLIKISSPNANHTSDTKVICSAFGTEQGAENLSITREQGKSIEGSNKRRSRSDEDVESNGSCSVASTSQSRSEFVVTNKSRHNHRFQDKRSIEGLDSDDDYGEDVQSREGDEEEDEEEFTCLECATCEENFYCQRCSRITRDGATGQNHCHRNPHHAMSHCSSLMEGVTSTTTNDEDNSSCAIAQNGSSSMYVIHGGQLESIETASMKEELEENGANCENISLHNMELASVKGAILKQMTNDTNEPLPLSISDSFGSRLACGCQISKVESARREPNSLEGCKGQQRREGCPSKNQCNNSLSENGVFQRDVSFSASRQLARSRYPKCTASCSNSDPCINCNSDTYPIMMGPDRNGEERNIGGDDGGCNSIKSNMPTSQSDCAGDASEDTKNPYKPSSKINMPSCTNATTTTTTTTTTLYSTKTNSIGSLLQVQNQPPAKCQGTSQLEAPNSSAHIKSSSIASTSVRSSRATLGGLVGSSVTPMPGTVTNSTAIASLRTMDSNRTTLMLIVVVTVFLMVEVPVAITHILHVVFNSFEAFKDIEFGSSLNYIKLFTNFFIMISYSVNFTIYCSMSKKFRETFRDLFLCGKRAKRKRAKRLLYQQQQQQQQSQYTQHHFNIQETQLITHAPDNTNITNNTPTPGSIQNDFAISINRINTSAGVLRYSPYKRTSGPQHECEL